MPRRYRRRRYAVTRPVKTTKYSNETYNFSATLVSSVANVHASGNTPILPVLQNTSFLGTRKAKNFTIKFSTGVTDGFDADGGVLARPSKVAWALVYVPEGTEPSDIHVGTNAAPASLYDPNQNVILSGVVSSTNGTQTFKTRLARNLNSNDQIYLVLYDLTAPSAPVIRTETDIYASVNFAIAF